MCFYDYLFLHVIPRVVFYELGPGMATFPSTFVLRFPGLSCSIVDFCFRLCLSALTIAYLE